MLRSMTGFGAASREDGDLVLSAEVRSVNHRHLNIKLRIPHDLAALEPEIEALVKKRLERGAVSITISYEQASQVPTTSIDPLVAKRYHEELTSVAKRLGIDATVSMDTLLGLPGVVTSSDNGKPAAKVVKGSLLWSVE